MRRISLAIAVAAFAFVPGLAAAQSAVSDPAVPGSGYKIPEVRRMIAQPLAASPAASSKPGDGYKIVPAPRAVSGPLAADVQDPGKPGDGYQMPSLIGSK